MALLAYGFFTPDLNNSLTLDGFKANLGKFEARRAASPVGVGLAFFAIYVLVASLSLPGTVLLALAAGALFGLLLLPLFRFFLANLLKGMTAIRTLSFYAVSQFGMLAGTLVYVNAGTQLAQLYDLSDIASPGLLNSLALLGLFPWLATRLLKFLRALRC